jgi:hypothetical protein
MAGKPTSCLDGGNISEFPEFKIDGSTARIKNEDLQIYSTSAEFPALEVIKQFAVNSRRLN